MVKAAHVSRALKAAGLTRSVSAKGRIKGLREYSEGFVAEQFTPETVQVRFQPNSLKRSGTEARMDASKQWAEKYAEVLSKHGFQTEVRTFGAGYVVRVEVSK